jgi:beta-mannosidase
MIEQSLNGTWRLREYGTEEWLPGAVPGGVHLDLIAAGRIADPFVGNEELRVQWVAERDWEYRRAFLVGAAVAAADHTTLVFGGLDSLAEISLNGELLGQADNMFRTWRWDVTGRLRPGENELAVVFRSAARQGAGLDARRHLDSANDQLPGAPYLRKSPSHFGWDWGPKLPNIGLWQGARLESWSVARLDDVRLSQSIDGGQARIRAQVAVERASGGAVELDAVLRVEHPNGRVDLVRSIISVDRSTSALSLDVAKPELWWPNGLGSQPLYRVDVELVAAARTLDARTFRLGLRTIALRREPDEWGESFEFVVNGVPIFAKGSNWIPADSFPARATAAKLDNLLGAAAAANHNMIRVWGGGYYETEAFYDACDRYGILVWQDFMFACSIYPLTEPEFLANLEAEVREQVRRLRHRACLALWCGNNELEIGWPHWGWNRPEMADLKEAFLRFFAETLPELITAENGAAPYWPGSPSSGRPLLEPLGERAGDYHEWTVWHGLAPLEAYTKHTPRFVSEFGFESLPALSTVAAFASDKTDWNLGAPLMDHHQRCPAGNARILYYLAQQFRLPRDFGGLVYLSQVLQAEAMRVGVEHWRRERGRCGGALYWQLNDCWPVSSWSSIDYFGRWKALHYATRRFYTPVLLSAQVQGPELVEGGQVALTVTNDLPVAWRGEVRWHLERSDGEIVATDRLAVDAAPLATTAVCRVDVPGAPEDRQSMVLVAELIEAGSTRALVVTPFVPDKHLALRHPNLDVVVETAGSTAEADHAIIRITTDTLARWVELSLDDADVVFGDNYFDLPAGREIRISFALPPGWSIERARKALRVRSVVDTYA